MKYIYDCPNGLNKNKEKKIKKHKKQQNNQTKTNMISIHRASSDVMSPYLMLSNLKCD